MRIKSPEYLLQEIPEKILTLDEWASLVYFLLNTLSDHFGQAFNIIAADTVDEESFSCWIHSSKSFGGPLSLMWLGKLGMETIGDERIPHVSATLFLFSQDKRLNIPNYESSYFYLSYEHSHKNKGKWELGEWLEDIYGEYDYIDGTFFTKKISSNNINSSTDE